MHISSFPFRQILFGSTNQSSGKLECLKPLLRPLRTHAIPFSIFNPAPSNDLVHRRKMPPIALPPSSFANPQSSSILNPQSPSTSNRQSSSILLNPFWSLPPLYLALPIFAILILILILRHRLTSHSPLHHPLKPPQTNSSDDIQHLPPPDTAKPLKPIPAPPPFPIPTIRRHSYPLTINSNSNSSTVISSSPSSLATDPSAKAKWCPGPWRPAGLIRQEMKENVNGCRRHTIVFQKSG